MIEARVSYRPSGGSFLAKMKGQEALHPDCRVFSISGALHDTSGLHLGRRVALQLSPHTHARALTLTADEDAPHSSFILAKKLKFQRQSLAHPLGGGTL